MPRRKVRLNYGNEKQFEVEIESERLVAEPSAPQPNPQFKAELAMALRRPLDFPSVEQAVIPGDRITVALDRHTPGRPAVVAGIWEVLAPRGIDAEQFVVIQPATRMASDLPDPRAELPEDIRRRSAGFCTTQHGKIAASTWPRRPRAIASTWPARWSMPTS